MPLPKRKPTEKRDEFVSRCIGELLSKGETTDRRVATAICYNQLKK